MLMFRTSDKACETCPRTCACHRRRQSFPAALRSRKMLTQRIRQRVGAPEKHPAVPEIVARLDKLSSSFEVRLFGKASHAQRAWVTGCWSIGRASFDIAVASFRTRRANAQHDYVFSRRGNLDASGESGAIFGRLAMTWSDGNSPSTASGSCRSKRNAARPMAEPCSVPQARR